MSIDQPSFAVPAVAPVAVSDEHAALASCHAALARLQNTSADWFAHYEDAQPDSAERAVLVELMRTAPDDFSKGLLYGFFIMRQAIAGMTHREFD